MAAYSGTTAPDYDDDEESLLRKICQSLFLASGKAVGDPNQPDWDDNKESLLRKIAQILHDASV